MSDDVVYQWSWSSPCRAVSRSSVLDRRLYTVYTPHLLFTCSPYFVFLHFCILYHCDISCSCVWQLAFYRNENKQIIITRTQDYRAMRRYTTLMQCRQVVNLQQKYLRPFINSLKEHIILHILKTWWFHGMLSGARKIFVRRRQVEHWRREKGKHRWSGGCTRVMFPCAEEGFGLCVVSRKRLICLISKWRINGIWIIYVFVMNFKSRLILQGGGLLACFGGLCERCSSVQILRSHVMVRIGGGWDTLESYLDRHDPCRCNSKRKAKHFFHHSWSSWPWQLAYLWA